MSLKILFKYGEKSSKLAIPSKWSTKTVSDVMNLFIKSYNAKLDEAEHLVLDEMHLVDENGAKVFSDAIVGHTLGDRCEYSLEHGKYIKFVAKKEATISASGNLLVKCKNYGCQKMFDEDENSNTACEHHSGPPIFHDTMKCWSCCKDNKAFDFENFQLIKGCTVGRHSTVDPAVSLAPSPNAQDDTVFSGAGAAAEPALKSIDAYNDNAKDAGTSGAAEALKIMTTRKSSRKPDGTAKCQRKGCGQTFIVKENADGACTYHAGQPVFHDAIKYWSCCDEKKCYDFDEFLAVPGCATGCHDDGEIVI